MKQKPVSGCDENLSIGEMSPDANVDLEEEENCPVQFIHRLEA